MRDDQPELTPEILETLQGLAADDAPPAAEPAGSPAHQPAPAPQSVPAPQISQRSKPRSSAGTTATRQPRWRRRPSIGPQATSRQTAPGKRKTGLAVVSVGVAAVLGLGLVVALAGSSTDGTPPTDRDQDLDVLATVIASGDASAQLDIEVSRLADVERGEWRSQVPGTPLPNIAANLAAWERDRRTRVNQLLPVVELLQTILTERGGSCDYRDLFDGDTINVAHVVSNQADAATSAGIEAYFDWVNEAAPIRPGVRLQITRVENLAAANPSDFAWVTNLARPDGELNRRFGQACTPVLFSTIPPDSPSEVGGLANQFASSNLAFATTAEASIWASWAALAHPDATRAVVLASDEEHQQLLTSHANAASNRIIWFEDAATTARELPDDPYDVIGLYGPPCPLGFTLEPVNFMASACATDINLVIPTKLAGGLDAGLVTLIDPHQNPFGPGRYDVWTRWVRVLTANSGPTLYERETVTGIGMHGWVQVEALRQAEQLAAMRPDIPEVELLAIVATNLDVTLPSSDVRLRNSLIDNDPWLFEQGQIVPVVLPGDRVAPEYEVTVSRPG